MTVRIVTVDTVPYLGAASLASLVVDVVVVVAVVWGVETWFGGEQWNEVDDQEDRGKHSNDGTSVGKPAGSTGSSFVSVGGIICSTFGWKIIKTVDC